MNINKMLDNIKSFLLEDNQKQKFNNAIIKLLSRLKDKKQQLKIQLNNEQNGQKQKMIRQSLLIVNAKQKKGQMLQAS
ncbi:MAG: hypothetical protein KZQ83_17930 [gamma proteobacterium symbiont of Taylorina sp.]|nr:hypothetical protein [gamma proteobacterium symbiont of Taylorina sp.]